MVFALLSNSLYNKLQLFAEHLSENLLLKLPHRQFVFTIPKLLRVYFKNDRNLFEEVSKIIFVIVTYFYKEVVHKPLRTGLIVSHQTFGDMLRFNPHWLCIILEGINHLEEKVSKHLYAFSIPLGALLIIAILAEIFLLYFHHVPEILYRKVRVMVRHRIRSMSSQSLQL